MGVLSMNDPILIAQGENPIYLLPKMANRHGLIAGATGTGKTVTLQTLAENFSARGIPVFMADVKGDLAGMSQAGGNNPKVMERAKELGISDFKGEACPVVFWDVFGENGHPVRATVSEMGPLLLGRLLSLNDTQEGVLNMVFRIADENGLLLLDLKDLRSMLQYVADNADQFKTQYGNVSAASAGAIQRNLLELETQGADKFFGEPALDLDDLIQTQSGRGVVNILAAEKLMQQSPKVYATFLLWLLSELFERLPEIGDPEKPKLVFFFDEAHLLFADIETGRGTKDRTDGAVDSVERRRRLFREPESARYSGRGSGPAREPGAARLARLYAARSKSGSGRGADVSAESETQSRDGPDRAGRRRGARLHARRGRQAGDC